VRDVEDPEYAELGDYWCVGLVVSWMIMILIFLFLGLGRRRLESMTEAKAQANVQQIVEDVKNRALFKTRRPEGKAGDH
jgi:hypothetical protein